MTNSNIGDVNYTYPLPSTDLNLRIRNTLSQFSDIFSEFNKYIAPAYHHDRCERSVQMRLYTMHKREFVMVLLGFFCCFSLAFFIGLAGPPVTYTTEMDATNSVMKDNHSRSTYTDVATGPFVLRTPALTRYNQQLWVIATLKTDDTDDETFVKNFQTSITIQGITEEHKPVPIIDDNNAKNRTRHLHCESQTCNEYIILHLGFLYYKYYILNIRFFGLLAFHQRYHIKELTFYFKTYNPGYTQIEISFRLIFLLATFILTCWFANTLKRYPIDDWSIEQKWVAFLLPLLLGFNNPIFPMMFLVDSWIPGLINAIMQVTFICALLMFWLCVYHGLRQNDRRFITFYLPKIAIIVMIWIPVVIISFWQRYTGFQDPTYVHTIDSPNFHALRFTFFLFGIIYFVYLLFLLLRAYSELRSMPFFDMRLKFLTLLMLFVLLTSGLTTLLKFGVDILEDSFVAQLSTNYNSSAQFMALYGLFNFYLYTMAYVYSPGNRSLQDSGITKDNPAFSMINDSDEDVIYGSDEESRKPLNINRNDDDSD